MMLIYNGINLQVYLILFISFDKVNFAAGCFFLNRLKLSYPSLVIFFSYA